MKILSCILYILLLSILLLSGCAPKFDLRAQLQQDMAGMTEEQKTRYLERLAIHQLGVMSAPRPSEPSIGAIMLQRHNEDQRFRQRLGEVENMHRRLQNSQIRRPVTCFNNSGFITCN